MTNLVVHQPIEITGNLVAHYPPKEAEPKEVVYLPWFYKEWEAIKEAA